MIQVLVGLMAGFVISFVWVVIFTAKFEKMKKDFEDKEKEIMENVKNYLDEQGGKK